jgi:hypothetical protein
MNEQNASFSQNVTGLARTTKYAGLRLFAIGVVCCLPVILVVKAQETAALVMFYAAEGGLASAVKEYSQSSPMLMAIIANMAHCGNFYSLVLLIGCIGVTASFSSNSNRLRSYLVILFCLCAACFVLLACISMYSIYAHLICGPGPVVSAGPLD